MDGNGLSTGTTCLERSPSQYLGPQKELRNGTAPCSSPRPRWQSTRKSTRPPSDSSTGFYGRWKAGDDDKVRRGGLGQGSSGAPEGMGRLLPRGRGEADLLSRDESGLRGRVRWPALAAVDRHASAAE